MKYELTEANVKDLIEWLRGGHVDRALIALEHLNPVTAMQAAIEAKPDDSDDLTIAYLAGHASGVRVGIKQTQHAPAPQAPARELTQPDLQRLWNDAMYANRQSTTDAAMEFGFAVQAALMAPEQKLEPLAGGWGVD